MQAPPLVQTRRLGSALALMLLLAQLLLALHQSQHLEHNLAAEDCQVCLLGTAPAMPGAVSEPRLPDTTPAGFNIARLPAQPAVSPPAVFRPRAPPATFRV